MIVEERDYLLVPGSAPRYLDLADRADRRRRLAADAGFAAFRAEVRGLLVGQSNRILVSAAHPGGGASR